MNFDDPHNDKDKRPITKRPKCVCGEEMNLIRLVDRYGEETALFWSCLNMDCTMDMYNLVPDYT